MAEANEPDSDNHSLHAQDDGYSDDESVHVARSQHNLSQLEIDIREEMSGIATQVRDSILGLQEQMQNKFKELECQIVKLETQFKDKTPSQSVGQSKGSNLDQTNENANNLQNSESSIQTIHISTESSADTISHETHSTVDDSQSKGDNLSILNRQAKGDNNIRLKPQNYSGTEGFEDFLAQFEITTEINGWDYRAKSLYLANSLIGSARSLLNELTSEQRRDYSSLVQKLTARYGSENRAEVFRAQLKSRIKQKAETIPELAQAIKKLTRQAYPKAGLDVIEALALDHFIDGLPEPEIRLRLREVGPKSLSEAETIAVRMEAHRIADKQRTRFVGKVEQVNSDSSESQKTLENQLSVLSKNFESLQKKVESVSQQSSRPFRTHNNRPQHNNANNHFYSNRHPNGRQNQYRNDNSYMTQPRGGNQNYQNKQHANFQSNQTRRQENFNQSHQGSGSRLN